MANLRPMYRGVVGDRTTELMTSFDAAVDTKITVFDSSIFPSAPNYVTVRMANKSCLATYKYTGISGNQITGLEFIESDIPLGQTAQYPIGSFVYWSLTHKLLDDIEYNIEEIGAAAGVQHASKTVYGVVKIGDGIDVDDGVISVTGGGAGGNYNNLTNKPKINSIELVGNKTALDLGLASKVSLEAEIVDRATQDTAITTALNTHIADKNNPHAVSKEQLGLGNVNNTSDMNKPVSSAQQTALNGKVDKNQGTSHAGDYLRVNDAGMVYAQGLPVASLSQKGICKPDGTTITVDANGIISSMGTSSVSFSAITGQPTDNTNLAAALNAKQDTLTFDDTPTASSSNPVKSGGIKTALDGKVDVAQGTSHAGELLKVGADGNVTTGAMPSSAVWGNITGTLTNQTDLNTVLTDKVDKIAGKGLSTNDYTTAEKTKLAGIEDGAQVNKINKILDSAGNEITIVGGGITINKTAVGLSNVDNTSDANKPVSTAMQSALDNKVTAEVGKGLSSNDFTNADKTTVTTITTELASGKVLSTNDYTTADKQALTKIETQLSTNPDGKLSEENFTTTLKTKLDSIPANAQENVIEVVKVNGTALTPAAKAVDVTVPTKVSDLTNDSGFQTSSEVDAKVTTHNSATDAHATLFAGKLSIEGSYTAGQIAKVDTDGKLKVMDASTASVGWNDVTSKPFTTVGAGLEVDSNALKVKTGTTAGTICAGDDSRLTDDRDPTAHAASHTDGTDDIQSASATQKGLLTKEDWATFNGKQNALTFDDTPTSSSSNPVKSGGIYTALAGKEPTITKNTAFNKNYGTDATKLKADGTAAVGTEDAVARIDHIHPTDTTRASASDLTAHTGNTSNPHSVTATQLGVEEGAQVNKIEVVKVNGTAQTITTKAIDLSVPTKTSDLTNDADFQKGTEVTATVTAAISAHDTAIDAHDDIRTLVSDEASNRTNADADLQSQIDALEAKALVKDIVGTYSALTSYDVSKLVTDDRIQVLQDETHSNANAYYKYTGGAQPTCWSFIGSTAETYTKTESDSTFVKKTVKVNGKALSADVTLAYSDVGALADTTTLADLAEDTTHRVVTDAEKTAWNNKVDKVAGKGLSTNDYTTAEKTKLSGIAEGAEVNVQSDWNETDTTKDSYIKNKPDILTPALHASTHLTGGTDAIQTASGTQNGLLSSTDWTTFNSKQDALTIDTALDTASSNPVQNKAIATAVNGKVDKVTGKGLSTNDYDATAKGIVDGVTSALAGKVDKVTGKGLSTEDYTTAEKTKLTGIEEEAQKNVQADWTETDTTKDSYIQGKPTVPTQLAQLLTDDANQRYSLTEKTKLSGIEAGAEVNKIAVIKDNNGTALTITDKTVQITKATVGLSSVDNTSDLNKPISTAVQAALATKLESSDLTAHTSNTSNPHSVTKAQVGLGSVEDGAQINKIETVKVDGTALTITDKSVNVILPKTLASFTDDATHRLTTDTEKGVWNGKQNALTWDNTPTDGSANPVTSAGIYTALTSKEPVITKNTAFNKNFGNAAGTVCQGNDARLSDARTPTLHASTHEKGGTDELAIDVSMLVGGVIDASHIPAGTFQKLVTVADQSARFALTTADVNKGDTVKQNDTGVMYLVVDTAQLSSESGYAVYTAVTPWDAITGKPTLPTSASGTLTASGWSSKSQTINISGMTSSCAAIVTPAPNSMEEYTNAGIICMSQSAGTLTFTCDEVPTTDLGVNVVMIFT